MSDSNQTVQPSPEQDAARKDEVASIAGQIPHLSSGDRAALRRAMLAAAPKVEGVVIGLLHRAGVPEIGWRDQAALNRWRLLAHVAAVLSGTAAVPPHEPGRSLGRALHEAGYSELRLMRLASARGPALFDQVVRAARFLAQANRRTVDLRTFRDLVADDAPRAERARLWIARDYFQAEHAKGNRP